jgi:Leucine-rich repeat (LRR) protein
MSRWSPHIVLFLGGMALAGSSLAQVGEGWAQIRPTEGLSTSELRELLPPSFDGSSVEPALKADADSQLARSVAANAADSLALVALYASTNGAGWNNSSGWLSAPACTWRGVTCDLDGRVIWISLSFNNLQGALPAELGSLSALQRLRLGSNQLTGAIPNTLGQIGASLTWLDLSANQLSGGIPGELGDLASLTLMFLNGNQLSGPIPPSLGALGELESLVFGDNQLEGPIPPELGQLSKLDRLQLAANNLSGALPPELGDLTELTSLSLQENAFSGSIPSSFANLTQLTFLDASDNQLTGSIPDIFAMPALDLLRLDENALSGAFPDLSGTALRWIDLSANQLSGAIPANLSALAATAEILELDNNQLDGPIPEGLYELTKLWRLSLWNNALTGSLSTAVGNLTALTFLAIDGNAISGALPSSIGQLAALRVFNAQGNQLSGQIPAEFGQLPILEFLNLSNNQLSGDIPEELGMLGSALPGTDRVYIRRLYLHRNSLTGSIPAALTSLSHLEWLTLWQNQLSGDVPEGFGAMPNLVVLDLDRNQLTGGVPDDIGQSSTLLRVGLSENRLSGGFPTTLTAMSQLRVLSLGDNGFEGELPALLSEMTGLRWLGIEGNSFSGPVPAELGSLPQLFGLVLNDNAFTGVVPQQLASAPLEELWLHGNELEGEVPQALLSLASLTDLRLQDNRLNDLPQASRTDRMTSLRLQGNRFEFDDLERGIALADSFFYSPQASFGVAATDSADFGQPFSVSFAPPGSANEYQWLRDSVAVAGATEATLNVDPFSTSDVGAYLLRVTSGLLPDLELDSAPISVVLRNVPPTAVEDRVTIPEDSSLVITVLANDVDPDNGLDPSTLIIAELPSQGTASVRDGAVSYIPNQHFNGTDSLTYSVQDFGGLASSAVVVITVSAVNDVPTTPGVDAELEEDQSVTFELSAIDPDGDTLEFLVVQPPESGSATIQGNRLTYTPEPDFFGEDGLTYAASDGFSSSEPGLVRLVITPVNDGPVAVSDMIIVPEDEEADIAVLANDVDVDDGLDASTLAITMEPVHGVATVQNSRVFYVPDSDFSGGDSLAYMIQDFSGIASSARVLITVSAVNDAPQITAIEVDLEEDATVSLTLTGSDADGDGLAFEIVSGPASGFAEIEADTLRYVPAQDYNGEDGLSYVANDGASLSESAEVRFVISPVNDSPIADADSVRAIEGTQVSVNVLSNDLDVDGDRLELVSAVSQNGASVEAVDSVITYSSRPLFSGRDIVDYVIRDPAGLEAQGVLTVDVTSLRFGVGTLDSDDASVVYAVDDSGTAVGADLLESEGTTPVAWLADGTRQSLGPVGTLGQAVDIDGGQIVGFVATPDGIRAATFGNGTVQDLGALDGRFSAAFAVSGNVVAGSSTRGDSTLVPVVFGNGSVSALGDNVLEGDALGVGFDGRVVGWIRDSSGEQPFVSSGAGMTTLDTGGAGGRAIGVAPDGKILGRAGDVAAVWSEDGTLTTISGMIEARSGSEDGWIVGTSTGPAGKNNLAALKRALDGWSVQNPEASALGVAQAGGQASIVVGGAVTNLNDRICPGSGWDLTEARDITSDGTVVGNAIRDGRVQGFRLNPTVASCPAARRDQAQIRSDSSVVVAVLENDEVDEAGRLTIEGVGLLQIGSIRVLNGTHLEYTPPIDFDGEVSVTYRVMDGLGGYSEGDLTILVEKVIPESFSISPVYPNPATQSAGVEIDLPDDARLRVIMFDVLGRQAGILIDEAVESGVRSVSFPTGNLASGVYFVRVEAGGRSATRSVVVRR